MPMYEYRCQDCGALFEQLRRMADADAGLECPLCGGNRVERQVSTCAVGGSSSAAGPAGGCAPGGGFS